MWFLEDGRAARIKEVGEFLWFRLFDVEQCLSTRAYERSDDLVFEVVDHLGTSEGPAVGRYRLAAGPDGATCRRTTDDADLTLPVAALGAAYLGGTRLAEAIRQTGATEQTPGALGRADRLFKTLDEPFCGTWF